MWQHGQHGQHGAHQPGLPPVPSGLGRIALWSQRNWSGSCGPYPVVWISGVKYLGIWGEMAAYDVQPGAHRVEVLPRHFTALSPKTLDVPVHPGQEVRLQYRSPNGFGFGAALAFA